MAITESPRNAWRQEIERRDDGSEWTITEGNRPDDGEAADGAADR